MIKIVHLIAHLELGGAEVLVSKLIKHQVSKDIKLELWCLERSSNRDFEIETIKKLEKLGIKVVILTESKNKIKRVINLIKNINEFKPSIINSHLTHVTAYAILGKILSFKYKLKIIETIHSTRLSQKIIHKIISNYLTIKTVAITSKIKNNLINEADVDKNRVIVIENGIEIPTEKISIRREVKKIISVGRLAKEKNHIFLLKSYELLKNELGEVPILEIYGDGNLREDLQKYIDEKNLQDNIKLMGTNLHILEKLKKSDIYVLPSKYEGLSISLLEAMGIGIPIIATKVPGILDIVSEREVSLVELDNIIQLKETFKNLIKNYDKRKENSIKCIELSKKYSLKEKAVEYNLLYKGVLNGL
ncbi:glycosyltransferase, partial [Cetobacterium sp.]|uniref:glycosyltransferase n=1 Tax=Cetobacterium sp. TaxID=2071632 RepID=UPI003EE57152